MHTYYYIIIYHTYIYICLCTTIHPLKNPSTSTSHCFFQALNIPSSSFPNFQTSQKLWVEKKSINYFPGCFTQAILIFLDMVSWVCLCSHPAPFTLDIHIAAARHEWLTLSLGIGFLLTAAAFRTVIPQAVASTLIVALKPAQEVEIFGWLFVWRWVKWGENAGSGVVLVGFVEF